MAIFLKGTPLSLRVRIESDHHSRIALPRSSRVCKEILLCALDAVHVGLVCFKTSQELGMDSVVHFRAKLVALVSSRGKQCCMLSEVTHSKCHSYTSVSFVCVCVVCVCFFAHIVVVIADDPEREIHLYL